jgi:hypothetical protein
VAISVIDSEVSRISFVAALTRSPLRHSQKNMSAMALKFPLQWEVLRSNT